MMCYIIMNGVKLPQPYLTMEDAIKAMNQLRAANGPSIFDIIYE